MQTVPIRRGTIAETATAYGTVQSEPGATSVVSLPFETLVKRVLVTPGQTVAADTPLVEAGPSPDAKLQLQQAQNDLGAADRNLKQVQAKLKAQLATNSELSQAEQAKQVAQTQLDSLKRRGVGEGHSPTAGVAGVVARIDVQQGAIVTAGTPMVTVSPRDRTEVKLGVEPEDSTFLKVGQAVELRNVHAAGGEAAAGKIRLIAAQVNPNTRLTDVYVTLPPGSPLVLDAFVSGTFQTRRADGLIVPRKAVLPAGGKMILYTAKDGTASRHEVSVGLENAAEVQISGGGVGGGRGGRDRRQRRAERRHGGRGPEDSHHRGGQVNVAAWAQGHARSILFLLAVLAAGGVYAAFLLPVSLFPHVDFPRVRISLDAGDRPADQMTVQVTTPVEEAVRAIPGVRSVRSTTSRGSAQIDVNFDWGHDMVQAMLEASAQVNRILPTLPAGTNFDVERMDPTVFPVIAYSLTSDSRSLVELQDLALYTLRPALSAVNGVAKIGVLGGATEEFRAVVDPGKLQSFGMTLDDVAAKLSAANVVRAVGRLQDHDKLYLVLSDTRFTSIGGLNRTVLRAGPAGVVLLDDVADVRRSTTPVYTRVTADGHDAVLFQVYQQPDGNTVQIAADVKAKLADLEKSTPILKDGSVKVANWYDQSDLVLASEHSTRDAILIGIALAAVVLFVFLRNWKITLIAVAAVPAVLAATILLLYARGMSFNVMTLGGMAAAVGLIIDDAIVMVEHITRRLHERHGGGRRPRPTAWCGRRWSSPGRWSARRSRRSSSSSRWRSSPA